MTRRACQFALWSTSHLTPGTLLRLTPVQMVKRLRFHPRHTEARERLRTAMAHDVCQSCAGCMFCRKEPDAPQSPPAEELLAAQR